MQLRSTAVAYAQLATQQAGRDLSIWYLVSLYKSMTTIHAELLCLYVLLMVLVSLVSLNVCTYFHISHLRCIREDGLFFLNDQGWHVSYKD